MIWRKKYLNLQKRKCNLFFTQLAWHQTIYAEMVQLALFQTKFVMELWIVKIAQMNSTAVSLFLICMVCTIVNYVLFTILIFINILYQFRTVKKTNSSAKIWLVFQITNTVMISRIVQILLMKCLVQPLQWVKTQKFLGFFFPKEGQLQIH